jgi:hypothetical protein
MAGDRRFQPAWRLLAAWTALVHLAFVALAVLGGIGVLWRPGLALAHLPAAAWAAFAALRERPCPLTRWENRFRLRGGLWPYSEDFIGRYLLVGPLRHLAGRSRLLGGGVLALNGMLYGWGVVASLL